MLNNILKVYGEDLFNGAINKASATGDKVIAAGQSGGALTVNVFAVGTVTTAAQATVTVKDGASESGEFSSLLTFTIAADKTFADGELIATAILPQETKAYVTAAISSATTNSGTIRVTLGYLAR